MCARRSKASIPTAALTALGLREGRPERGQPRQASAAPGRVHREETEASDEANERPSKTQLKQAAHDLQALGDALAEMPADKLARVPMDDSLRQALDEMRRTRSHEGRRRQRQYVGKLMRQQDIEPLAQAVADAQLGSARDTLRLHQAEALRLSLVTDDGALTRFMADHPGCDVQQLRSLIRSARKDAELPPEQRHGRAWRDLFQFIKPYLA